MKGFFISGNSARAGCKLTLAGCLVVAVTVVSCAGTPPPFRTDAVDLATGDGYIDDTTVGIDFYNDSNKTVIALEVSVPAAAGYLMRQEVSCTIPPGGSTRLEVPVDEPPDEPVLAAVTEIVYEDGSRFFDPGGRESILWW